jgi:hypothetical protein
MVIALVVAMVLAALGWGFACGWRGVATEMEEDLREAYENNAEMFRRGYDAGYGVGHVEGARWTGKKGHVQ